MRKKITTIAFALFGIAVGTAFAPNGMGATSIGVGQRSRLDPPGCGDICRQNQCPNTGDRLCGTFPGPMNGTCYCYWDN